MNFDIDVQQITMYTCIDGQQFTSIEEAKQHNKVLETKAKAEEQEQRLQDTIGSYLNTKPEWSDRKRAQAANVLEPFFRWYQSWDRQFIAPQVVPEEEVVMDSTTDQCESVEDETVNIPF